MGMAVWKKKYDRPLKKNKATKLELVRVFTLNIPFQKFFNFFIGDSIFFAFVVDGK